MRIINCEQGTAEWYRARIGVATASRAADALGKLKSGAPSKACTDYAIELAFERVSGQMIEKAVTTAMSRGSELEPEARAAYEQRTGTLVDSLGFALHDTLPAGASPDGLIGSEGLLEVKCPFSQSQVAKIWASDDIADYVAQVEWQMWILGREWVDVAIYDPRLTHAGMDLHVVRHQMTDSARARLDREVPEFLALVDDVESTLRRKRS